MFSVCPEIKMVFIKFFGRVQRVPKNN